MANDEVRLQSGDPVELKAIVVDAEDFRLGAAQLRLCPRPHFEWLVAPPFRHGDRHDTNSEQIILLGETGTHHPSRWCRNCGLSEAMLDRYRPVGGCAVCHAGVPHTDDKQSGCASSAKETASVDVHGASVARVFQAGFAISKFACTNADLLMLAR